MLVGAACFGCAKTKPADGRRPGGDEPPPVTGGFGDRCAAGSDCVSGICIDAGSGAFCSQGCADGCPAGWQCKPLTGAPGEVDVCVPASNNLCLPCSDDAQCGPTGDLCVPVGLGVYCARDCTVDACPDGYLCSDVATATGSARQCLPQSGTCDCDASTAGATRGCNVRNGEGICHGEATCDPSQGWIACDSRTPVAEVCNGVDDDCDGFVDHADASVLFPIGGASCVFGVGCAGENHCAEIAAGLFDWVCSYDGSLVETCDGRDNDCNGIVDDAWATDTGSGLVYDKSDADCGGCGNDCRFLVPNAATSHCLRVGDQAYCVADACAGATYLAADLRQCLPLVSTLCHACQDDADCVVPGSRCFTVGEGSFCGRDCSTTSLFSGHPTPCTGAAGSEDCCGTGYTCETVIVGADTVLQCVPATGSCTCDASTTDVVRQCLAPNPFDPPHPCRGSERCLVTGPGYAWSSCTVDPTVVELCNHVDDDCDGAVDEEFIDTAGTGTYDTDEHCGECFNDCLNRWDFNTHHAAGACDTRTSPFTCEMVCAFETGWVDANRKPDDGCECQRLSSRDDPDSDFGGYPESTAVYHDANCDGIDGVIGLAMYVSASNPSLGDGSREDPFQTIGLALAAFPGSGKSYILVAGGIYEEQVVLSSGIQMHGGYSDDFASRNIVLYPTILSAPEPTFAPGYRPGTLHAACGGWASITPTLVSGFFIYGYDVTTRPPGAAVGHASYAVYLSGCDQQVQLINSAIIGGRGGPGADGVDGARGYGAGDAGSVELNAGNGVRAVTSTFNNLGACNELTVKVSGGAGGLNSRAGCTNWGQRGGHVTCPRTYNVPDFYCPSFADAGTCAGGGCTWVGGTIGCAYDDLASGCSAFATAIACSIADCFWWPDGVCRAAETHKGFQAEYKFCTSTLPDCCPYANLNANPNDPTTWPVCTSTPYRCVVPGGEILGVCVAKRDCTSDGLCPIGYTCVGTGTRYCELPVACTFDEDCPSGFDCPAGSCVPGAYGGNGAGTFDSTMNVVLHTCNQITESGFPVEIDPLNGAAGAGGASGHSGRAGGGGVDAIGSIVAGDWVGASAPLGDGGGGQPGQPGGGGGAGGGIAYHHPPGAGDCLRYELAASGGGGGAGGCGGAGGAAGWPGGGSIAVFLGFATPPAANESPRLRDNIISRGPGGAGGRGGRGALGGFGGNGGTGAIEDMGWGVPYASGPGGAGGRGGAGGGGGGGCGGSSFGVLLWNVADAALLAANTYDVSLPPTGGPGGLGGASPDSAKEGGAGADGISRETVIFCGPGDQCPPGTTCSAGLCQ